VGIFRSKVVDISDFSIIIEVVGNQGKTTIILNILKPYKIIESRCRGKISIEREFGINTETLCNI
jgi:acetolactate synthase I/III small subunit